MLLVGCFALVLFISWILSSIAANRLGLSPGEAAGTYVLLGMVALILTPLLFSVFTSSVLSVDSETAEQVEKLKVASVVTNERGDYRVKLEDGQEMWFNNKGVSCDLGGDGDIYLTVYRREVPECFATVSAYKLSTGEEGVGDAT